MRTLRVLTAIGLVVLKFHRSRVGEERSDETRVTGMSVG